MRVVLDSNILVSALIAPLGWPAAIVAAWFERRFTLLTCQAHLAEFRSTLRKPRVGAHVRPHAAGRLINQIREFAQNADPLPTVRRSPDPDDDYLLALAEAGNADYLVTGDQSGLLDLVTHRSTQIVSPARFAAIIGAKRIW